jgi:hypothetical protein
MRGMVILENSNKKTEIKVRDAIRNYCFSGGR